MQAECAYPVIADTHVLHLTPHEGYLRDVTVQPGAQKSDMHMLNDMAAEIVSRFDGTATLGDVMKDINAQFEGDGFDLGAACLEHVVHLLQDGLIDLHDEPVDGHARIRGSRAYECPSHFMIELTDQCNLRCEHCYRDSSPERSQQIDTPTLLNLIGQMADHGVSTVELTGGEPTMRKDFLDIFHYCAQRFSSVAIVSNGWFITEDWARQMGRYNNVIVQIDLDGSHARAHDTLRGRPGSFERALRAGRAMAKAGVRFRVAMNVYAGNFDTIYDTAALALEIGANWFSFSPVTDLGRGREADMISFSQMAQLMDIAKGLETAYGDEFIRLVDEGLVDQTRADGNCGAGWRSLVLGPNGDVRPCVMVEPDAMAFGNLLDMDYVSFLEAFNGTFFRHLKAPGSEPCDGCPNHQYCHGCFARTLRANEVMVEEMGELRCAWRKHTGFGAFVGPAS